MKSNIILLFFITCAIPMHSYTLFGFDKKEEVPSGSWTYYRSLGFGTLGTGFGLATGGYGLTQVVNLLFDEKIPKEESFVKAFIAFLASWYLTKEGYALIMKIQGKSRYFAETASFFLGSGLLYLLLDFAPSED